MGLDDGDWIPSNFSHRGPLVSRLASRSRSAWTSIFGWIVAYFYLLGGHFCEELVMATPHTGQSQAFVLLVSALPGQKVLGFEKDKGGRERRSVLPEQGGG